ncbi:MAG: hypothetical protein KAW52_00490 [candidate division Zixibacteria bacterium]|nr:hypothetical protein [candidate division Zixibacteria bacterium]
MPVKIKDYITRDTKILMQTFNTMPRLESVIQNQRLMLEATCDVRKELLEVLRRLSWLGSTKALKDAKIKKDEEEVAPKLSRKAEAALPLEERVKVISDRTKKEEAFTKDEDVDAF